MNANNGEFHTDYWLKRGRRPNTGRPRLLVVDDHELVVRAVSRALGGSFDISEAYNGRQAFRLIEVISFDVAIVDHDLPDTKGTEILRKIFERVPSATRVLISGREVPGIEGLRSSGLIHSFLLKPVDLGEILRCVQSSLA